MRILRLIILLLGLLPVILVAQNQEANPKPLGFQPQWNIQLNWGITQYYGDLNKDNLFNKKMRAGFGGMAGYQFAPAFGVRGQFLKANLFSDRGEKKLRLNSDLWDVSVQATFSPVTMISGYKMKRLLEPYIFAGAGITTFSSTITDYSTGSDIDSTGSQQNEFMLPVGAGVAIRMTDNVHLEVEYADHITFNDNTLDMFEAKKARDQYGYLSAGLGLKFGGPRDIDKDGVKDKEDACPEVPGKVELKGCPDKDNDGLADHEDLCPDVAGKAEFLGCPDSDNDGIPDKDDKCPNASGKKEFNGCPDKDNDGIIDSEDKCPDAAGKKELNGCPDKDGDGIADKDDTCPEIAGLAKFSGCPDKDNDGVPDNKDLCPEIAGTTDNNGCPVEEKLLVNEMVHFNTDDWVVIAMYNQQLNKVVEIMKDNPGIRVQVDGHADARESELYNLKLSEKRADFVIAFMTKRGIERSRLIKNFYGKSRPIADNATEEGMSLNRRVEIKSVK